MGTHFSDERIRKWLDNQFLRYRTDIVGSFAAVEKASGAFVGLMGLQWNDIDEVRGLEIGYMVSPRFWRKGFATEGAAALARYAFDLFGINRVYATIRPENTASQRVAERIGMKVEGGYTKHFNDMEMEHTIYVLERLIE